MLTGLAIRDIVLVETLALDFGAGLTVLTGETGAGKSILLDALGLAIGARADSSLVRHGAARGSVSAEFRVGSSHPVHARLADLDLDSAGETLVLRRTIDASGGSRAHINDQPVSVALLREFGDLLVEIHGQHDDRGLLDPAGHRHLLDEFGGHEAALLALKRAHEGRAAAQTALAAAEEADRAARADEDYVRHAVAELRAAAPQPGEEAALAEARARMMRGEKLGQALAEIEEDLVGDGGPDARLRGIVRRLERTGAEAAGLLAPVIAALDRAATEAAEGIDALGRLREAIDFDPARAGEIEERLFALRALARKHRCDPDALAGLAETFEHRLASLDRGADELAGRAAAARAAGEAFSRAVLDLRAARAAAAGRLDDAVAGQLPPLHLEKARFRTRIEPLAEADWNAGGGERVTFEVATNAGAPFGPLVRIASGGELARFILALKVALITTRSAATLIFDEVDRGVGGATADAVGARLAHLATRAQMLVVTHSPQVAARGDRHLRIEKREQDGRATTRVVALDAAGRREEIARMLSGARVTDEARAAASRLIEQVP